MTHMYKRAQQLTTVAMLIAIGLSPVHAQSQQDTCEEIGTANEQAATAAADKIKTRSQGGSGNSPFEAVEQNRNANDDCMVDFSGSVGPAVGNGALGGFLDQITEKMSAAACQKIKQTTADIKHKAAQIANEPIQAIPEVTNVQLPSTSGIPNGQSYYETMRQYAREQAEQQAKIQAEKAAQDANKNIWDRFGAVLGG